MVFPVIVRDALSFFASLEKEYSVSGLDCIKYDTLGTMAYLLLYRTVLRWPWSQIQPIILSWWEDPQGCLFYLIVSGGPKSWPPACHALGFDIETQSSPGSPSQIHPRCSCFNKTSCRNSSSCGTGWKHLIWWSLELPKVAYLGSSDCSEIENQENRNYASFLLLDWKYNMARSLFPYLKKLHFVAWTVCNYFMSSYVLCKSVI